jgi:GT2 family glycosyltransferase
MNTAISVCIPTVRPTTIRSAVSAVMRQEWTDWELLVVGQGPDEEGLRSAVHHAASGDPRIRYLHLPRTGLSYARNAAVAGTSGQIVAFTDDDCEVDEAWLAVIAQRFSRDPLLGLVGGAVLRPSGGPGGWLTTCPTNQPAEVRYDPVASQRQRPQGWDWIGANFAVRRDILEKVGPFDEALGAGTQYPSAEDTDLKFRLESLGVPMLTTPDSIVWHTHGARSGVRAGFNHSRNYARGNAAMAAKLTLVADPFGEQWRRMAMRGTAEEWRRDARPHRLPVAIFRRWQFARAYREVISGYLVSPDGSLELKDGRGTRNLAGTRARR